MKILKSCMIAISMYSKLSVPQFEWKEESMRYSMAFFPVVGVIIGAMQMLLFRIAGISGLTVGFYAAIATALPVLITGGIHVDGFMDTTDALSSYQSKERRLEILKDAHIGAFAVIGAIVYFVVYYGGCQMIDRWETIGMIATGYVISRVLSGLAAITFPAAKKTGTLATFSQAADKKKVCGILIFLLLVMAAVEVVLCVPVGIAVLAMVALLCWYYYKMSLKQFGGITGDLAGWFLQNCELVILLVAVVGMHLYYR